MEGSGEVRRIHIVYFLCRNGKIEQPHLIQVHHLYRHGVRLRDVKRWVSELRGDDMAGSYAWSYKRRYRGGYVWQDLTDDDLITAISDNEYVLKGSLLPSLATDPFNCEQRKSLSKQHADAREEQPKIMAEVQKIPNRTLHVGDNVSQQGSKTKDMGGKASITMPGSWQRSNAAEKKKKKKKKMETELIKSDGNGWKATNVMRNFIGCRTVETKGSGIRVVRRQEVTREAAV